MLLLLLGLCCCCCVTLLNNLIPLQSRHLHSIGEIIFLDQGYGADELIIANPSEFYRSILSRIFTSNIPTKNGMVRMLDLATLLQLDGMHVSLVVRVLERLRLSFPVDMATVFMPALLPGDAASMLNTWLEEIQPTKTGYRWKSGRRLLADDKALLPLSAFANLQQRLLMDRLDIQGKLCKATPLELRQDAARFTLADCEFLIRLLPDKQGLLVCILFCFVF